MNGSVKFLLAGLIAVAFTARAEGIQYLVLVDRSAGMATREVAARRTVEDLIRTGFQERIRPGEKFAVWFCDQTVNTNAPVFTWDPARVRDVLMGVNLLYRVDSGNTPGAALPSVLNGPGRKLTLALTDGFRPWTGCAFDAKINAAFGAQRDYFTRVGKPFLVMIVPDGNGWFSYGVHTNLASVIEFPPAAPERKPPVIAKIEPKPETKPPSKPETKPEPKRVVEQPKVVKTEPVAKAPPPVVVEMKPEPKLEPKPAPKVEAKPEPAKIVETPVSPPPPPPQNQPTPTVQPKPSPVIATVAPEKAFPWGFVAGAIGFIGLAGFFTYRSLKPAPRTTGSLISQSLGPEPRRSQKR